MRSGEAAGLAASLTSSTVLAITPTFIKIAYEGGADAATVGAARACVMTAGCFIACLILGRLKMPRPAALRALAAGLIYGVTTLGFMVALNRMEVGTAIVLLYLHPAMVAAWRWLRGGAKPSLAQGGAVALSLLGVAMVAGIGTADGLGILLGVSAAAGLAALILLQNDAQNHGAGAWQSSLLVSAGMSIVMAGAVAVEGGPNLPTTAISIASLLFVSVTLMAGLVLFAWAMQKIGALRSTLIGNIEPVIGIAVPAVILGEQMTALQISGALLVVLSLLLLESPQILILTQAVRDRAKKLGWT
jgi:drug/metabolite transporter (DMT)-like permease